MMLSLRKYFISVRCCTKQHGICLTGNRTMTKRTRQIANFLLAAMAAAMLTACAGGKEFQGTPQEGASRTGVYPKFGHLPKAATAQITPEEKQQLTTTLDADRTRLAPQKAPGGGFTAAEAQAMRRQAQEQTNATLKQIESGQE
ncbi:hypothetical protein BSS2_I1243 [Brucella suis bv. 1 str. S2]|uniref:Uncharacterized protein n=1 Tax=Brucella suis biovar 1 (strain 1330) TaxID=204722 RepID=A0A0H3G476_BRUSU|nr:hypothetical protein BR1276 [Brucella suis 1330]AEK54592.1 hypothetical protein BPI_I1328 [Brucella pinnipedialis B2/94]AEU06280.1 hypothetical protein BSVBI22_A1272 [Brucella suis VBI22]AHN46899.1 hypothetical protein BSS2_I1243 [Brucella suis bv. 1 str. S2]CDL76667.1 unnamed protein product [Brucella canis str. Oliveri]